MKFAIIILDDLLYNEYVALIYLYPRYEPL